MNEKIQLNKGDIIKDGENYYTVFCVMCSVIYVQCISDIGKQKHYKLSDILKYYRKIQIIGGNK